MTVWKWIKSPVGSNDTADGSIDWQENMSPAGVNNSGRAMMAAVAKWRDDIGGTLVTTGGPTAYSIATTNQGFAGFASPPPNGTSLSFQINQANNASATLSIDAGTAYPLQTSAGTAVTAGLLQANTVYSATFRTVTNAWILNNVYSPVGIVPIGSILPYAGSTAPNSNFALCFGQSLAGSSFPTLRDILAAASPTFPYGGNATNFNVPDLRGRLPAGKDNMGGTAALRITNVEDGDGSGHLIHGSTLGSDGGLQGHSITVNEMPAHAHPGSSAADSGHTHLVNRSNTQSGSLSGITYMDGTGAAGDGTTESGNASITLTIASQGAGASNPISLLQPTIILNYIIRVL